MVPLSSLLLKRAWWTNRVAWKLKYLEVEAIKTEMEREFIDATQTGGVLA